MTLFLWVNLGTLPGQGGGRHSVTHHLKCENSVEKDQQTHTRGHDEALKAQGTLLISCKQPRLYTHTMPWSFSLYLFDTNYVPWKQPCTEFTRAGRV